ncbi:MAG: MBL fold metallo-hydrolase [Mageeibacillus sp.]|jgi:beta-lactamase superfamily II metal-dependent hydrolase|nr:MBL fold metallo-hydrolase [Mageeibacillus sp.]
MWTAPRKSFQVYNIGGSNYFRLRDIAYVLSGTESKFSVVWDAGSNGISVTAGEDYTADGTEMSVGRDMSSTAVPSRQSLTINGEAANLAPYNIGGTNFFRLRELGAALSFGVSYDAAENSVAITSGKTAGNAASVTVSFIDVGQGDSVFIDDGTYEVLIDAGTADKGRLVSDYIKPYVDGDLDLVIATHAHADHVGGLTQVINDYKVDEIIDSGDTAASKAWQNYHAAAVSEQLQIHSRLRHDCVHGQRRIHTDNRGAGRGRKSQQRQRVRPVHLGKVKVLLTGDSEEAAEAVIAKKVGDVDVFKAGHHGSRTANSMALLSAIKPEYVVVSCGAGNTYGHPHTQALENFASVGAVTYGTVKSGTVVMTTDGAAYSFNTSAALTLADAEDNGGAQ